MGVKSRRNIVEEQIRLFILIAGGATALAALASTTGSKALMAISVVLLLLSPFIAYIIALRRLRGSSKSARLRVAGRQRYKRR